MRFAVLTNRLGPFGLPVRPVPDRRVPPARPRPRPVAQEVLEALPAADWEENGRSEPLDVILVQEDHRDEEPTAEGG
jgi:hypothetical protein